MSYALLYMIIRIALVVVILLGMIVLLMGINHYMFSDRLDTREEAEKLKKEVEQSSTVISNRSLFHRFLPSSFRNRN